MDMNLFLLLVGMFQVCHGSKVYDWQRDWGTGLVTMEMANIQDGTRHILHSSLTSGVDVTVNTAAISLHDFNFTSDKFRKGIIAIRPIMSLGTQVCFVTKVTKNWSTAVSTLERRHKAVVSPAAESMYRLQRNLPDRLDPRTVQSVAEFCDVDRRHIFYMKPVTDLSTTPTTLKIQGLFSRYNVGIPDKYVDVVVEVLLLRSRPDKRVTDRDTDR